METLGLRMARHMETTHKVLAFLQEHPQVAWVQHPDLEDHPDHALAQRQLPKGAGSIVAFGVKGGEATGDARTAGQAFIENCRLASH
ncbi:PLP-dependent transferase, partial [Tritonibacter sp. SIMBA_163]|uniref:PLP-dependent transferase n=1 Tax=Tritonibacter sp. SIMBA_163 TaxID=3080868 RepID=UPI00397FAE9A